MLHLESPKLRRKGKRGRNGTLTTGPRPSRARRVESVEGSCEVCGSTSWDSDDVRGETVCSECGYVASENMIDPGAEWVNHSNGDDRSRVGAPTTLTLSDKGLSTEIRRSDLTSGGGQRDMACPARPSETGGEGRGSTRGARPGTAGAGIYLWLCNSSEIGAT